MECKLRCVNIRRVSDPRSTFQPAFRVTAISDDWYRSTLGVIETGLRTSQSARESFRCTMEHLGAPATRPGVPATSLGAPATSLRAPAASLGAPATSLGAPTTGLGAQAPSLGAPRITVNQSGKNNIFLGNAACAPGNHSYYLLFNNF